MNEPSDFIVDENSKESLLQDLPDMLVSSRQTWNKISQSLWSASSFEKLYDSIGEIASNTALYDMPELAQQATALHEYFDGLLNTNKVPTSGQINEINQLFDLLEQAHHTTVEQFSSVQPEQNRKLFFLSKESLVIREVSSLLQELDYEIQKFQDSENLLQTLVNEPPAAIIVDTDLLPGLAALREEINRQISIRRKAIPLIFINNKDDITLRLSAMQAGAARYFSPPHDSSQICAEIVNITSPEAFHQDKVLIIEDDPSQAEFAASILRKAGFMTETVTHPLDVMQALKTFIPDLILMDIYMPDANGLELTTIIRDDLRFITTPIIFLSGETDPDKQIDALVLGGDDFISKPIRPKHLIAAIKNRIKRTRDLIHAIQLQQTGESGDSVADYPDTAQTKIDADLLAENDSQTLSAESEESPSEDEVFRDKILQALENNSFRNYYQPILSVEGHADDNYSLIVSMPDEDMVIYWEEMLGIAEKYDLQHNLDQWAVTQALESIKELSRQNKQGTIFLPQSSYDITHNVDPEWIKDKLRSKHMVGTSLVLEFDLNTLASNIKDSKAYFSQLSDMGIKTCLTHFPAKKAAFKLLHFLRADFVKVSDKLLETENSVINTFIHQTHKLRAQVIVANISDPRYINLHWTSKADYIQGDFISPASETMNFNFSQAAL